MVSRNLSVHKEHEILLKLEDAGIDDMLAQKIIDSKSNYLAKKIVRLVKNGGYESTASQLRARDIMGKNFFGIEEAIECLRVEPTDQQLALLSSIPFPEGVLALVKRTHTLVAVFPLSILEIRKRKRELFELYKNDWYAESEMFARESKEASWQLVCNYPYDDSFSRSWVRQEGLLCQMDDIPSAQVMVYTIIGHYLATHERLFKGDIFVRTSSVNSEGYHIQVGGFSDRLDINYTIGDGPIYHLGLASSRRA
ncbi:MAG: hypothetical protein WC302_02455 [Candidatus Paceibacterota bacterium]|jgi:hypothetical protein